MDEPCVCGGTGDHDEQPVGCCDECCEEWEHGAREAGFCAQHSAADAHNVS